MSNCEVNFEIAVIEARLDIDERYGDDPYRHEMMHKMVDLVCADVYARRVEDVE